MKVTKVLTALFWLLVATIIAVPSDHVNATYSLERSRKMLTLTRTAYCKDLTKVGTWTCKLCALYPTMTNVSVVSNKSLGMQLFVGVDPKDGPRGSVLVSFRGSEVPENYIKDLEFGHASPFPECQGCLVHSGMLDTYNSIRTGCLDVIKAKLVANPGAVLRVTGHSMGASMAELMCVDLQLHYHMDCTQLYTYGTPRSGNQAFVTALGHAIPSGDMWRVTHWRDPVPHLPPADFGYVHAVTEIFYNYDFTVSRQCIGGDDPKCCQQFDTLACIVCCTMEHLKYLNETIGQATCT